MGSVHEATPGSIHTELRLTVCVSTGVPSGSAATDTDPVPGSSATTGGRVYEGGVKGGRPPPEETGGRQRHAPAAQEEQTKAEAEDSWAQMEDGGGQGSTTLT